MKQYIQVLYEITEMDGEWRTDMKVYEEKQGLKLIQISAIAESEVIENEKKYEKES